MSLRELKKQIKSLQESIKTRPLNVLLNLEGPELSDSDLETIFNEVPVYQIPTSILLEYVNRVNETSFKSLEETPEEFLLNIIDGAQDP